MVLVSGQDHRQSENPRLTMDEITPYLPGLSPVAGKELCARFDGGRLSSDGGVLLFPGIERRLGIAGLPASCLHDERDPASTTHSYADMIRARVFAIACGYEDCDDLDVLRFCQSAFKRDPQSASKFDPPCMSCGVRPLGRTVGI